MSPSRGVRGIKNELGQIMVDGSQLFHGLAGVGTGLKQPQSVQDARGTATTLYLGKPLSPKLLLVLEFRANRTLETTSLAP